MTNWNCENEFVLIRVDYNVPIKNGIITDDTRILKSLPTLEYLLNKKAKLIVLSHLGRPLKSLLPDGSVDVTNFSLQPIATKLSSLLKCTVKFATDCGGSDTLQKKSEMKNGDILVLENTRFQKEEEKGDVEWAKKISSLGSYFVNDAFGAAHREHATTAVIAKYFDKDHKAFGLLMAAEVENGIRILKNPSRPLLAILGGAKVSDKIELIGNLINLCDTILIGGGMAFTFLAARGFSIGKSLCEVDKIDLAKELLITSKNKNVNILLPLDFIEAEKFSNDSPFRTTSHENISSDWMGLDIGPKTIELYTQAIRQSKTIIWNGPMGVFEMKNFSEGTKNVALAIAQATDHGAFSLIGGGDSVAAVNLFGLENEMSFISTGGGAMLEMLEGKELPGVSSILE